MNLFRRIISFAQKIFGRRLSEALVWTIGAALLSRIGFLLINLLLAKFVSVSAFALWSIALNTVQLISGIVGLGVGGAAAVIIAAERARNDHAARLVTMRCLLAAALLSALAAVLLIVGADLIGSVLLRNPEVVEILTLTGPLASVFLLNTALSGILAGWEEFRAAFIAAAIGAVGMVIAGSVALYYDLDVLIPVLILAQLIQVFYAFTAALKRASTEFKQVLEFEPMLQILTFGGKLTISGLFILPMNWFLFAYLSHDPNLQLQLALFSILWQIRTAINFLPGQVISASTPILSGLHAGREMAAWRHAFFRIGVLAIASGLLPTIVVLWICYETLPAYKAAISSSWSALTALILLVVAESVNRLASCAVTTSSRAGANIIIAIVYVVATAVWLVATRERSAAAVLFACAVGSLIASLPAAYLLKREWRHSDVV